MESQGQAIRTIVDRHGGRASSIRKGSDGELVIVPPMPRSLCITSFMPLKSMVVCIYINS